MEDDSCREDIANRVHLLSLDQRGDLWGHIPRSATAVEDVVVRIHEGGKSEIDDDWIEAIITAQHDVFRLDVSMHDPIIVDLLQSPRQTDHELLHLSQAELSLPLVDAAVQLARGEQLQDDIQRVIGLEDTLQFDEMRGIYGAHDADLVEEGESVGGVVGVDCVLLGEGLHREVAFVGQPLHLVDCRKAALAQFLDGLVEPVEAKLVERPGEQPHPDLNDTFSEDDDLHGL